LNPLELLDGAVTCGEYHWAGLRNPTYHFQRSALVRELLAADGKRLRFAGLVVCRGYNQSAKDKERAAMLAAKLAGELGADGAIVTTDAGGNSHTDTMLTVRACEQAGIGTVALSAEMGGLTDHVPEADCIVSTGNAEEYVAEWFPERIIGGDALLDGRPAAACGPVPVRNYLGATCQMGDLDLRAVAW
jgi:glycine reductase